MCVISVGLLLSRLRLNSVLFSALTGSCRRCVGRQSQLRLKCCGNGLPPYICIPVAVFVPEAVWWPVSRRSKPPLCPGQLLTRPELIVPNSSKCALRPEIERAQQINMHGAPGALSAVTQNTERAVEGCGGGAVVGACPTTGDIHPCLCSQQTSAKFNLRQPCRPISLDLSRLNLRIHRLAGYLRPAFVVISRHRLNSAAPAAVWQCFKYSARGNGLLSRYISFG